MLPWVEGNAYYGGRRGGFALFPWAIFVPLSAVMENAKESMKTNAVAQKTVNKKYF